jgi:hypothetical protein
MARFLLRMALCTGVCMDGLDGYDGEGPRGWPGRGGAKADGSGEMRDYSRRDWARSG